MRKELDRVTLMICDTKNYGQALYSLRKSLDQIKPARTIFFTDIDIPNAGDEIEVIKIKRITSKEEYSHWVLKELFKYIWTEFVLVTQWDGYVLCWDSWNDEFYNYDYFGSPWVYEHDRNVGNGGFSLRSYALLFATATDPIIQITHPEDQSIGILYRRHLEEKYRILFPTEDLADTFSFELKAPTCKTFGFHGHFHEAFKEVVMITRQGALGDIVALEPVLEHFHNKGYRVVLNTLPQFFNLFVQHHFKVYHPQELDQRIPIREINLDMAYEVTPVRLHLSSYYEMAGITDGEIRNPRLILNFNPRLPENKLFPKYAVLHIDKRAQPGRNIYGIDWSRISDHLNALGYTVVLIGKGEHDKVKGTIEMNAPTELMLMWLLGGSDLFIGIDSGPANIAVSMGTKAVILFGSVNPEYIYPDLSNIEVVQHKDVCRSPKCWHSVISVEGVECIEDKDAPPCTQFSVFQVYAAINKILCK